jgi:hypothetical protein
LVFADHLGYILGALPRRHRYRHAVVKVHEKTANSKARNSTSAI